MKRLLIVNADDCNLTRGVTRAILECHDRGILSSTTFMINLPVERSTIKDVKARKNLGVGIHLNVTLGNPVSKSAKIKSLLRPDGNFRKVHDQTSKLPKAVHLATEYQNQINLFRKIFGRMPTHLDTHHQVHDHPFFLDVLMAVAQKNKLPFRRSRLRKGSTDFFFGNLSPENHWTREPLVTLLKNFPEGTSEIMCHPGIVDSELRATTSFLYGRAVEHRLFKDSGLRALLAQNSIRLIHYGML